VTQTGSIEGLFGVVVFTVFVALPWTALTLALGAVLYLAGRPASSSRAEGSATDTLPFGAGDADDG
jgi:hypothetical protein